MTRPVPLDVTDRLRAEGFLTGEDENPEDRVYELDGVLVKVKTFFEQTPLPVVLPGGYELVGLVDTYRVSGSEVGPDGKALRIDGRAAVYPFGDALVVQADDDCDLVAELERKRFDVVEKCVRASRNRRAAGGLTGVGVRPGAPIAPGGGPSASPGQIAERARGLLPGLSAGVTRG